MTVELVLNQLHGLCERDYTRVYQVSRVRDRNLPQGTLGNCGATTQDGGSGNWWLFECNPANAVPIMAGIRRALVVGECSTKVTTQSGLRPVVLARFRATDVLKAAFVGLFCPARPMRQGTEDIPVRDLFPRYGQSVDVAGERELRAERESLRAINGRAGSPAHPELRGGKWKPSACASALRQRTKHVGSASARRPL